MPQLVITTVIVIVALIVISLFFQFVPIGLWITSVSAGVSGVTPGTLFGMRLRRVPQDRVVLPLIAASKAGINVNANQLETHYLAGGNVDRVVNALISAHRAQIPLTFEKAAAIDLAGRNVLEAVQMSVNPKVIETPNVAGVARNGVEMKAFARVTVRANIDQFVGGAGEQTVLARVGEGIVTTIGSANTHLEVMEKPDAISKTVLAKGLDAGTAFEILSIDIADVVVGQNIGARLQTDQAEADKRIAQAKAEERRVMAVAREQEMKAYTQEMQAKVVESQAQVPQALADALRGGNLGVMDYYSLRNLQADTAMRSGISRMAGGGDDAGAGSLPGSGV
ncbi:MAG: flotillin-like protein FloA [Armatimonadetes bacterium]|nr:flotillin-like protein FloA [Armatimonadota bacterium]